MAKPKPTAKTKPAPAMSISFTVAERARVTRAAEREHLKPGPWMRKSILVLLDAQDQS